MMTPTTQSRIYVMNGMDSDVYVRFDGESYHCHATGKRYGTPDVRSFIEHLKMHVRRGDKVPSRVIMQLIDERDGGNEFERERRQFAKEWAR